MRPIVLTASGDSAVSNIAVVDHYRTPFNIGIGVVVTGAVNATVQHTFDDVLDDAVTPTWFEHPTLAGLTANTDGNYAFPVRGIRVVHEAGDTGDTTVTIIQAGMPGL